MNPVISVLSSRRWNRRVVAFAVAALVACSWCVEKSVYAATLCQPNIVVILADDLGYGDVGCYNDQAKAPTPNIDRLAGEGMRFTDAHSPCTVCTPTRYSLMTGQRAFRVPRGGSVFTGVGGPSLITPGRLTLPAMVRCPPLPSLRLDPPGGRVKMKGRP